MKEPQRFANLPVATWPRLRGLLDAVQPGGEVINMTIGSPQHPFPDFVPAVMAADMASPRMADLRNVYSRDEVIDAGFEAYVPVGIG